MLFYANKSQPYEINTNFLINVEILHNSLTRLALRDDVVTNAGVSLYQKHCTKLHHCTDVVKEVEEAS